MKHDLRYAVRTLARSPGFTATAIAALALGIGASTAIFSVVNKVLLEPLPYPEPDRLVQLITTSELGDQNVVSIQKFEVWHDFVHVFKQIAAYEIGSPSIRLTERGFPETLNVARVSADYFALFGAEARTGRAFSSQEDRPGGGRVAVISDGLWRRRFGGDPRLIGRTIPLENEAYKVVGVLEPETPAKRLPAAPDIWLPLQADARSLDHVSRVAVVARLKPGFTLQEAQNAVRATRDYFVRRYSPLLLLFRESFTAIPLRDGVAGDVRGPLYFLTGAVALVLLISCANVANLVLARATRRSREIAIRAALGAERKQIVRQLLSESALLAFAGGAVGIAAGYLGVRGLLWISPTDIPRIGANGSAISVDWRVLLFTLTVSAFSGILFGLAPALKASRADVSSLVKESASDSGMQLRRNLGRSALVIAETAMALVLLAGAGLLIRSFVATREIYRGFDERNVSTVQMSLASAQFDKTDQVAQLLRRVERRLAGIQGVSAVASTSSLPLERSLTMPFTILAHDQRLVGRYHGTGTWLSVSPGYFDALRIVLLRGRKFTAADRENAAGVVIINRAMLAKYWQEVDADPIGQFITIGKGMAGLDEPPRQIIGIVADVREAGLKREPMMYVPVAQLPDTLTARNNRLLPITWVVRTSADSSSVASAVQEELHRATGGLPLQRVRTMRDVVAASSARNQFYAMLLAVFAGTALLLAGVGLYGLMAYSVQQRTQEIGIRMALGAGPQDVRNMVVWQGMRLALIGIVAGIPMGLALTRVMDSMIFGIRTWDPMVFAGVAALMGSVAWLAAYLPSIRATRVAPVDALRN